MGALKSGAFPVELNGKEYGLLFSLNALDEVQEKFGGYDKLSEVFNKDNPNLFKDTKSMIYGYRAESVIVDCYNEGDVSTGMRIRFTALGTVSNPILLNVDTEEFIQINATMKTGDVIEINTKYGSKGAKLIRDGVETDCDFEEYARSLKAGRSAQVQITL